MLDPDVYDPNGQAGSTGLQPGGSAGKSTNGGGLLGTAGTTVSPTTPGSNVDTTLATTPCQRYCAGYGTQCRQRLEGKNCLSTCQDELNGSGPFCQSLGIETLSCLTPFFSPGGGDCGSAIDRGLTQCKTLVTAFDDCKNRVMTGSPNPVSACPRSGDGGVNPNCVSIFSCGAAPYVTFCSATDSTDFVECSCAPPVGNSQSLRIPMSKDPCFDATALCP